MRDVVQELLHGIAGQTLRLDAPEGRPSSVVSCTVYWATSSDESQVLVATTGAPAIETGPDTTLTAAAGQGQADRTTLAVTSATGIVRDRAYLLTSPTGAFEWVEFVGVNGTACTTRVPLINAFAVGSTLKSVRMTQALLDTWVADRGNASPEDRTEPLYRASWVYVVNGVTYRHASQFDLVRYTSRHAVTPLDVDIRFPGWIDRLPIDHRAEQGRRLVDQAWREVRMDLRANGKLGRWVTHADVVSELVITRANHASVELAALAGNATPDQLKAAHVVYQQRFDQLIVEPHTTTNVNGMGGQAAPQRESLFRR